jgi:hypothetical protein
VELVSSVAEENPLVEEVCSRRGDRGMDRSVTRFRRRGMGKEDAGGEADEADEADLQATRRHIVNEKANKILLGFSHCNDCHWAVPARRPSSIWALSSI